MNDDFCTYEQSKALKELGYRNEGNCYACFIGETLDFGYADCPFLPAPTKSQTLRFFRDKFGLFGSVWRGASITWNFTVRLFVDGQLREIDSDWKVSMNTYEDAESALIDKLILLVGEKK